MPGQYLGSRATIATKDIDGSNPYGIGNWTAAFTPAVMSIASNLVEIYHMALKGPVGSAFQVYIDRDFYGANDFGKVNEWDPSQPMILPAGKTLYFYFNTGVTPAPVVTVYLKEY